MLTAEQFRESLANQQRIGRPIVGMAESLGVSRQAIYQYLRGQSPSPTVLLLAELRWGSCAGDWPLVGSANLSETGGRDG